MLFILNPSTVNEVSLNFMRQDLKVFIIHTNNSENTRQLSLHYQLQKKLNIS
jgi:hypothetical protein